MLAQLLWESFQKLRETVFQISANLTSGLIKDSWVIQLATLAFDLHQNREVCGSSICRKLRTPNNGSKASTVSTKCNVNSAVTLENRLNVKYRITTLPTKKGNTCPRGNLETRAPTFTAALHRGGRGRNHGNTH